MLHDLITEIDTHLKWREANGRPLAESTFGRLSVNDGKLMARLRCGSQITVDKMQRIRSWIAADKNSTKAHGAAA